MQCHFIWPPSPQWFGQYYIIAVTAVTVLIAAPGNLITALVVIRNIALRNESAYLLICSVCFADAIVATVTQPLFAATIILGSRHSCVLDHVYFGFAWLSSVSSTLGIVTITLDRYVYIVHPLLYHTLMTKRRARYMICMVWSIGILFGVLPLVYHNSLILQASVLFIMISIAVFMVYTYGKVYRQVSQAVDNLPPACVTKTNVVTHKQKSQSQATKTVLLVVIAFFGCWFPWVIVSFMVALSDFVPALKVDGLYSLLMKLHWIFLGLGYCNSALNVFIYGRKNTVLQKAVSKYLVDKQIPLISRCFCGKQVEQKKASIRYSEGSRMRAATTLTLGTTPMPSPLLKPRSQTFISVLSF